MTQEREIPFTQELLRKSIHMVSLSIPIVYTFVDKETALCILIPLTIIFLTFDILSKFNKTIRQFVYFLFGKMLRQHETGEKFVLNGASWVLISAVICILVFPKLITVVSFTILIISDLFAALIGRKFGQHKLGKNKSWEGSIAFVVTALIVVIIYGVLFDAPMIYFVAGFFAAIVSAIFEAYSPMLQLDDNLSIPISAGVVLWLFGLYAQSIGHPFLNLL